MTNVCGLSWTTLISRPDFSLPAPYALANSLDGRRNILLCRGRETVARIRKDNAESGSQTKFIK